MGADDFCNTGLVLGLGLSLSTSSSSTAPQKLMQVKVSSEPLLTLCLSGSVDHSGGASSLSVKRERETDEYDEEVEADADADADADGSNANANANANGRKKLRLTKVQSALLEDNFKDHTTLNPKQKQDLARELKLRPRQVEVWFQNRRARSKLKQTEVDCEFLKKCCETLTDENRRLKKELHALKGAKPIYMQLPAATTLTMCPTCERLASPDSGENATAKSAFKTAPKRRLYRPFANHPSAAC